MAPDARQQLEIYKVVEASGNARLHLASFGRLDWNTRVTMDGRLFQTQRIYYLQLGEFLYKKKKNRRFGQERLASVGTDSRRSTDNKSGVWGIGK